MLIVCWYLVTMSSGSITAANSSVLKASETQAETENSCSEYQIYMAKERVETGKRVAVL